MRRLFTRTLIAGVLGVALLLGGCDLTDVTDLNENPNASSEARPDYLFNNATKDIAENYWGQFTLGRFGNLYGQYWTQNQYTAEDRYGFPAQRSNVVNNMWGDYYLALNDLQEIIQLNEESPEQTEFFGDPDNQIATATIMQAWTFHVMTDIWGPIPFSEALSGAENAVPSYDSQREVYFGLLDMLDEALNRIDTGASGFTSGDPVYGGDMEQWAKFANALKMRIGMRMADVEPDAAQAAVEDAANGPLFESPEDNAMIPFDPSPPYQNPIYENYEIGGRDDWAVTENLVDLMETYDDPRLPIYAETSEEGDVIGYPYGLTEGDAQARYSEGRLSRPGQAVRQAGSPAYLMFHDEVLFILAEAAERGWNVPGDAETYYQDAIASSLEFWGVEDQAAIDDYIAGVPYDAANWEQSIGEQKWLALYMQGIQGWAEWRRLDFENVLNPPVAGSVDDDVNGIAVRLTYPNDEANLNAASLQAGIDMLEEESPAGGGNTQGTRLWWDVEHNY